MQELPLFREFPSLSKALPRVEFVSGATPIEHMKQLEVMLNPDARKPWLWVKRDDRSHLSLGGNKARKLEFIMGEVKARGSSRVVTSGGYGSNHALATTIAARELGLGVTLILGPQPPTDDVRKKLLAFHALGAELKFHNNFFTMGLDMLQAALQSGLGHETFRIAHGGSSLRGMAGYVNAVFEMKDQLGVERFPERIVVPIGTGGTTAGILAGLCLAGLWGKTQVVAVSVVHPLLIPDVEGKARQFVDWVRAHVTRDEKNKIADCGRSQQPVFELAKDAFEPGYGEAKPEVYDMIRRVKRLEGIQLDPTYSGKAMKYLSDIAKNEDVPKTTLFILTYNSHSLDPLIDSFPWKDPAHRWRELPEDFWPIFESQSQ